MGSYLSLSFDVEGEYSATQVAEPLFESTFFEPIAVGGITMRGGKDQWYLAGYALEHFIALFQGGHDPSAVGSCTTFVDPTFVGSKAAQERVYMRHLVQEIPTGKITHGSWSMFEKDDPNACVTYLPPIGLSAAVLPHLSTWLQESQQSVCYYYGALRIAVQDKHPWQRAFRYYYPPVDGEIDSPTPILYMSVRKRRHSKNTYTVILYTQSSIWLQTPSDPGLTDYIGLEEADENLEMLASLARSIKGTGNNTSAELNLEGSIFFTESERIRAAFSDIL